MFLSAALELILFLNYLAIAPAAVNVAKIAQAIVGFNVLLC